MGLCSKSKKGFKFTGPRQERNPFISDLIHGLTGFGYSKDEYQKFRLTCEHIPGVARSGGWWWFDSEVGKVHGLCYQSLGSSSAVLKLAVDPNGPVDKRTAEPQVRRHEVGGHCVLIRAGIGGHPEYVHVNGKRYKVKDVLVARWPMAINGFLRKGIDLDYIRCVTIDPATGKILRDTLDPNNIC